MRNPVVVLAVFMLLSGSFSRIPAAPPPVLFLKTSINYAWGYAHRGFFIDSTGTVFTYSFTQDDNVPNYLNRDTLPEGLPAVLHEKGTPAGRTIGRDTLLIFHALADSAAKGVLTFGHGCEDFGTVRYSVCRYTPSGQIQMINCFQQGDEPVCNSSPAAKAIARWLLTAVDSVNITEPVSGIPCAPDSCLVLSATAVIPRLPLPVAVKNGTPVRQFHLDGKKADAASRLLTVDRNGKRPIHISPAADGR